jgi:hypothetical protein
MHPMLLLPMWSVSTSKLESIVDAGACKAKSKLGHHPSLDEVADQFSDFSRRRENLSWSHLAKLPNLRRKAKGRSCLSPAPGTSFLYFPSATDLSLRTFSVIGSNLEGRAMPNPEYFRLLADRTLAIAMKTSDSELAHRLAVKAADYLDEAQALEESPPPAPRKTASG